MSLVLAILTLLPLTLFLLVQCFRRARRSLRRSLRLPPGPWQLPILGYLPWIDAERPHETLTNLARRYGPICALRMGSVYTVVLSDPTLIRQALAKDAFSGRAPLYLTHGIMQGYGLICAEGELWRDQRRFVTGFLRNLGMVKYGQRRDKMEESILRAATDCISRLMNRSTSEPFEPLDILHHCIGNLVNSFVFGKVYDENDTVWKWLRYLQEEGVKEIGIAGPLNFLPFLRFLPRYGRTMKSLIDGKRKTHEIYRALLNEHRELPERARPMSLLAAFDEQMRKNSSDLNYFTEPQLYHLLADLFGAGTDTTLTTLRWFLLFVAVHSEEQEKIQEEMYRALGEREPTLEDRPALRRLEAAIAEVQRLRSVTPLGIPHGTTEDTRLAGYDIPKGTMVIPLQWAIHTDPTYWTEPLCFRPERFIAEDGSLLKPEAFLPFQSGKRVCVGDELARMMLFLFAARILKAFVISISPEAAIDLEGECGITLVPKSHPLLFEPRKLPH